MSDDELVARVRDGDDGAFEQLYGRYSARVGGFVAGMVGDAGRSEDVTQEVFVSALRRLRATDRDVAFKPWVYEIARNAAIDEFRRTRRLRETPVQPTGDEDRAGLESLAGGAPGPEQALASREAMGDLTTAMGGLTDTHRRVLVLRELEGRTYEEIAALTGLTHSAVESALFRARRRLSAEYDELASGRRCATVCETVERGVPLRGRARDALRRHLAHCQPCRRHAVRTGFDLRELGLPTGRFARPGGRIAALLPLPALGWLRRGAELFAGSGDQAAGWGKAATATAVMLFAGGTGVAVQRDAADNRQRPALERTATAGAARAAAPEDPVRRVISAATTTRRTTPAAARRAGAAAAPRTDAGRAPGDGGTATAPVADRTTRPAPPAAPRPTPAPAPATPAAAPPADTAPAATPSPAPTPTPTDAVAPAPTPSGTTAVDPNAGAGLGALVGSPAPARAPEPATTDAPAPPAPVTDAVADLAVTLGG